MPQLITVSTGNPALNPLPTLEGMGKKSKQKNPSFFFLSQASLRRNQLCFTIMKSYMYMNKPASDMKLKKPKKL